MEREEWELDHFLELWRLRVDSPACFYEELGRSFGIVSLKDRLFFTHLLRKYVAGGN